MSSISIDKAVQTQIANIEKNTGKKLNQWIKYVQQVAEIPFNKKQIAKHLISI